MSGPTWTPERVKDELPIVDVTIHGTIHRARLSRAQMPPGLVVVRIALQGQYAGISLDAEWSAKTVANCLNAGRPLLYA